MPPIILILKINLIDDWKQKIDIYKWRNGLWNIKPFINSDEIIENILYIFPKEDFDFENPNSPKILKNFIALLIYSQPLIALHKLDEYSKSIKYLRDHPDDLDLKNLRRTKVNYAELQNRLFELFINRLLHNNNIEVQLNDYYMLKGTKKPLDGSFNFEQETYLIESKKIYSTKQELIKSLALETLAYHDKFSKNFSILELFGGYIKIKTTKLNPGLKNLARQKFQEYLSKYYKEFRNNNSDTIKQYQFSNDELEIKILPAIIFDSIKKDLYDESSDIIIFQTKFKTPNSISGVIKLTYNVKLSHFGLEDHVFNKMKDKLKQHEEAPIRNKIFAFEFENIENFTYNNSLPVNRPFFQNKRFASLVEKYTSILLVIKNVNEKGVSMDIGVMSSSFFNPRLVQKLNNLTIK